MSKKSDKPETKKSTKDQTSLPAFPISFDHPTQPFDPAVVIPFATTQKVRLSETEIALINELVVFLEQLFLVDRKKFLSAVRLEPFKKPRLLFLYFVSTRTRLSQKAAGAFIPGNDGRGRDHSTVIHSLDKHLEYLFRGDIEDEYMQAFLSLCKCYEDHKIYHKYNKIEVLIGQEKKYREKWAFRTIIPLKSNIPVVPIQSTVLSEGQREALTKEFSILFEFMGMKNVTHVFDNYFNGGREKVLEVRRAAYEKRV